MIYPPAKWLPVRNHGWGRPATVGLVVHVAEGNGSLFGWFDDPASQVSSHFWVSKAGAVEQYVDTQDTAWAQAAGNLEYLSVETEGFDTEPLTAAQGAALALLIGWCHQTFGIPLTMVDHGGRGITTHAFWPSGLPDPAWGGHPCPGKLRAGQLPTIVAAAGTPAGLIGGDTVDLAIDAQGRKVITGKDVTNGDLMVFTETAADANTYSVIDVTQAIHNANPGDPHFYRID